jgi:formyltetrahydrofolate hydrolase
MMARILRPNGASFAALAEAVRLHLADRALMNRNKMVVVKS